MPIIATIYGIKIYMNFALGEHNPPHIHGDYNHKRCAVSLDGEILTDGGMSKIRLNKVIDFVKENENELKEMWETQQIRRIEK